MGALSWKFYSRRRKASITNFLKGVVSHEAAYEKFTRMGIVPPRDLIEQYFSKGRSIQDPDKIKASTVNNTSPPAVEDKDPEQEKYDELIREIVEETTFDS